MRPYVRVICMSIIVTSILLDIAIYRWRWTANWILYFEGLYTFVGLLVPSYNGPLNDWYVVMLILVLFLATYTNTQAQILFLTFIHALTTFVTSMLIEQKEMTIGLIIIKTILIITTLNVNTMLAALI